MKSQPVLFPPSTQPLLVNALKFAPPVAEISLMLTNDSDTEPDALKIVALVPATELFSVIKLPEVPANPSEVTVCVVPAVRVTVAGCTVSVMLANVLDWAIVNAPVPPWFKVGHVLPPPLNVLADALVMLIVPVDALTVSPVTLVLASQFPATDQVPLPSVSVFVPANMLNVPIVMFFPLPSIVPFHVVNALVEPCVKLSKNLIITVLPPPPPTNVGRSNTTPFVVMLTVPDEPPSCQVPVAPGMVMLDENVKSP